MTPLSFTGRPMGGFVDIADAVVEDDARRTEVLALALDLVRSLPPK